jgi:transcriptional regulator with XRE-family HTH domain
MDDTNTEISGTGDRFRRIAELLFDGNKSELARALSMKPGSFTKYLRGKRRPGAKILKRLTLMGVNINWFLTGEGPLLVPDSSRSSSSSMSVSELQNDPAQYHPIPFVQVRLTDDGSLQLDEVDEPEWLSRHFIQTQYGVEPDRLREFRVSCNRMSSTIRTGDRVRAAVVAADLPMAGLVEGQAYLMFGPDGVFATRVRQVAPNDGIVLAGDNPEGTQYDLVPNDWGSSHRPIARILEVIRPM